jgi:hypothetical protein
MTETKIIIQRGLIIFTSAFIIEICSTFYIKYVSDQNAIGMFIFAAIGPFLGLPFINYMIESKDFKERFIMAIYLSMGYLSGSIFVYYIINQI